MSSHGVMPHRSGTLQLSSVMFLTRDLTVIVLSRVVSQALSISIKANSPYRIALRLVRNGHNKNIIYCVVCPTNACVTTSKICVITGL